MNEMLSSSLGFWMFLRRAFSVNSSPLVSSSSSNSNSELVLGMQLRRGGTGDRTNR